MEYADDIQILTEQEPELARQLAGFHSLEKVLTWMRARGLPLDALDVIAQDEYSHDMLIPLEADGKYLAFGMT